MGLPQLQPQAAGAVVSSCDGAPQQALFAVGSQQLLRVVVSQQPPGCAASSAPAGPEPALPAVVVVVAGPVVVAVVLWLMVCSWWAVGGWCKGDAPATSGTHLDDDIVRVAL